ncbi:sigma-70 family RNA polymerase sigma factor [Prauserella halophila]|uniref:Sigma-70 family RNA polymerase sigma factor n=1 Tax=Prauserella halophila TaxID=185641 RepID=A0ABN1W7E0_9PSEU|nr:sigma-70 family RNA polymerase sigma factor [Prauserella halophila]MCP2235816.1 RNA polymerase sigma-70 factor, ECF subfamily [Prauserella halophila]
MGEGSAGEEQRSDRPGTDTSRIEVLRDLHDRYATALWRYVVSLTKRPADADDIVQETLLRAWRTPRVIQDDPVRARGWLFTVARNLVIDQARSASRRHEHTTPEVADEVAEDRVDRLFDAMLVSDALASLGPHHREVLVRAYYGGLSTAELSEELGIPEGTVKSRLHYGLCALRLAFQERGVAR